MTYPESPELAKLKEKLELQEFTQRLGEALDYGPLVLAEWVPDNCRRCSGTGQLYQYRKDIYVGCDRCNKTGDDPDDKRLAHRSPSNKNLAILFDLDHNKMEAERDAVLKHVQAEACERSA